MSSDDLLSKREAERFYTKAVKEFDRWFFSLTKNKQAALREAGVKPYRELRCKHYVYPVNTKSETQVIVTPWDAKDSTEHDTFYSREKVEEFTRRLLDTLGYSLDPRVRLHFLLVKLALKMPDAIDGTRVAKLFGITKAGVSFRVQRMRAILAGKSPEMCKKQHTTHQKCLFVDNTPPSKEAPVEGGTLRVASHPGQKTRV